MIGGQIEMREKGCSYNPIFHISNCEIKLKISLAYGNGTRDNAVAPDFRAVCGAELRPDVVLGQAAAAQGGLVGAGEGDAEVPCGGGTLP